MSILKTNKAYKDAVKALGLKNDRDTQWCPFSGGWVPRDKVIGQDGISRMMRKRNEEPNKRAKNSDYTRLFNAFSKMREDGAYAKWNIVAETYSAYLRGIPKTGQPTVTHCRANGICRESLLTGLCWTKEWEPVQDWITIETQNGGFEIAKRRLGEAGFRFQVISNKGNKHVIKLIFRGNGENKINVVHWTDNERHLRSYLFNSENKKGKTNEK